MGSYARTMITTMAVVACLALPTVSAAAPIQYDFSSGAVEIGIFADNGATEIVTTEADLVGTFVTFDDMVPELVDFELVIQDTVDLGFFGIVDLDLTIAPGLGFSAPASHLIGTQFIWQGGPIQTTGEVTGVSGMLASLLGTTPIEVDFEEEGHGYFSTGAGAQGEVFGFLNGRSVTEVEIFGVEYKLQIRSAFKGEELPIPEPSSALLIGLALLGLSRRRAACG